MSDVVDEEVILRIKKAYLSGKNIDSVYEQLLYELKNAKLDTSRLYTTKFLREFMEQMMVYLFNEALPKMKGPNFTKEPKKTMVLLNAIAIQKVLSQIKDQLASLKRVGITSFPVPLPTVLTVPMATPPVATFKPATFLKPATPATPINPVTPAPTSTFPPQRLIPQQSKPSPLPFQQCSYLQSQQNFQSPGQHLHQRPQSWQMQQTASINGLAQPSWNVPKAVQQSTLKPMKTMSKTSSSLSTSLDELHKKRKKKPC